MRKFNPGDRVSIAALVKGDRRFLATTGRVIPAGGYGHEDGDVMVRTDGGDMIAVTEDALAKIED